MTVIYLQNRMNITKEFKINKEKRTVVCILTTYDDVESRIQKYQLYPNFEDDYYKIIKRVYKGVAKCSPEDEWNESYGKKVAEYRAEKMRQADVNNNIKKFINKTVKKIDNLYDYGLLKEPRKPYH